MFYGMPQNEIILFKIGTDSLTDKSGLPDKDLLFRFTKQIAALHKTGNKVLVVSSGAVGLGRKKLGWNIDKKLSTLDKALASGVGQPLLETLYARAFAKHGLHAVGQALLENAHFSNGENGAKYNFREVVEHAWRNRVIFVANENDVLSRAEIKPFHENNPDEFLDNDGLVVLLGKTLNANRLVIVSSHCVHTKNPSEGSSARPVAYINFASFTENLGAQGIVTKGLSQGGTGGMASKLNEIKKFLQESPVPCGSRIVHILSRQHVKAGLVENALCGDSRIGTTAVCCRPFGQPVCGLERCSSLRATEPD